MRRFIWLGAPVCWNILREMRIWKERYFQKKWNQGREFKIKGVAAARLAARAVRHHREKILMNSYSNCATIDYLIGQKKFVQNQFAPSENEEVMSE